MNLSRALQVLVASLLSVSSALAVGCPFKGDREESPCPHKTGGNLRHSSSSSRFSSLVNDPATKERISDILQARAVASRSGLKQSGRSLQEGCVNLATYGNLQDDVVALADAITNIRERGHFLGGIVRLAAHDFMDFDRSVEGNELGSDGCLDFQHPANAGLSDLWCDDSVACPLKALHDDSYSFMSRADFWIAAANAVIQATSINNQVVLPFRWGRIDRDPNSPGGSQCVDSSSRLPAEGGCSDVEGVFLDRMGLSWTDAVALLGAHTLGRGHAAFSGHDGAWVDTDGQTIIFDKRFYEEVVRRAWFPRTATNPADNEIQNWTWGGANRDDPVMMLNTDICLRFDIPDGAEQACCTDITGNCRGNFDTVQCPTSESVRPEAFAAFNEFIGGDNLNNGNNAPFYNAFVSAWEKATENGHTGLLSPLTDSCGPVEPTLEPTASPLGTPVSPPPTAAAPTTLAPTVAQPLPSPPSPTPFVCQDSQTNFLDDNGNTRDCAWVVAGNRCKGYGHLCPLSCDACLCRGGGMFCSTATDCCSLLCRGDSTCQAPVWAKCDSKTM